MSENILCRLCAHQSDDFVGIFEKEGKNLDLVKKISQCLQILLLPDDVLPKEVCKRCCIKLDETFKFHECCSQAQQYLISLFSEKQPDHKTDLNPQIDIPEPLQEDFVNDSNPALDCKDISLLKHCNTTKKRIFIANLENDDTCKQVVKPRTRSGDKVKHSKSSNLDKVSNNSKGASKLQVASKYNETTDIKSSNTAGAKLVNVNEVSHDNDENDDGFDGIGDDDISDPGGEDDGTPVRAKSNKGERKGWFCYECSSILRTLPALREHYTKEHNKQPLFKCEFCPKAYGRYRSYARHIKTHDGEKKFSCEVCGKRFAQKTMLKAHSAVHSDDRPYSCQQCGKTFKQFSSLFIHNKTHSTPQTKFPCTVCPKLFTTKQALMVHLKSHSGERDFVCDVCGKSFVAKGSFDYHLTTHTPNRPHVCHVCGKSFRSSKLLTKHATLHTGVKPYQCDVCGKQFRERSALKEHERIHTGAMPYSCEHCGRRFRFKGILTVHLRQHTGERPYCCSECPRTFTNWANLNKHTKRRHKNVLQALEMTQQPTEPPLNETNSMADKPNFGNKMDGTTQTPLIRVVNDSQLFGNTGCEISTSVQKSCEILSSVQNECEISTSVHKVCDIPSTVYKGCEIPSTPHKACQISSIVHEGCEIPSSAQSVCANSSDFSENTYKMSENCALVTSDSIFRTQQTQIMPVIGAEVVGYRSSDELHFLPNHSNNLNS